MGLNSTATAYNFGQLGSAHMHNDNSEDLTPPDGVTAFDKLTADTSNSVVYGGTESNNVYFGITNGNTGGNSEAVDASISFPAGMTIYGRWSVVSLNAADTDGGIIAYFGY
jgi:hypothetical protein